MAETATEGVFPEPEAWSGARSARSLIFFAIGLLMCAWGSYMWVWDGPPVERLGIHIIHTGGSWGWTLYALAEVLSGVGLALGAMELRQIRRVSVPALISISLNGPLLVLNSNLLLILILLATLRRG